MPVHQASVVCGFCKLGTDVNDTCGRLHKAHLKNGSICAAHHRCMQYSYFLGQYKFKKFGGFKVEEVVNEIKRARKLKCMVCKKPKNGASAKCGYWYCKRSFHYYCVRTTDNYFARRICIRRHKSSRPVILYRVFCSKDHEKKSLNRGAIFQEAFGSLDSDDDDDDDTSDSSGESENDFELIEDVFKKEKEIAKKARLKSPVKKEPVEQPKQLSRAERLEMREKKGVGDPKNIKKDSCTTLITRRNTTNSNSQNVTIKDENSQSKCNSTNFSNCNNLTEMKCPKSNCENVNNIPKVLNNRTLSVTLERLSDSVINMEEISKKVNKNGHCIKNLVSKKSERTILFRRSKRNNHCKLRTEKISPNFCEKSDCQKPQQSVVKISGSCQKMVKEVRKGLFGDSVGALIQICLEKLPLDLSVHGSVNLLDQKSPKLSGQSQFSTELASKASPVNGVDPLPSDDYLQVQKQKSQIVQTEVCSVENIKIENNVLLTNSDSTENNTSEHQHQSNSNEPIQNGCSDFALFEETEPSLISSNSSPPEIQVTQDEEEGHVNLQVETLSMDLSNCSQPSSPRITPSQEQETMVLCICRNKKCDLQSQSRILRICKNRYQASKMNVFFWHDIMPPGFKPEYLPYFFLDIVECLRLKMYEVFFTLLFKFDQKHSEKFQCLIDIEDDSVIKEQEATIWTTVASYLKKASLDSGKEVGILMSLEEQEVMLLPINEVNDTSFKIRQQLLCLRSQSQVIDASIQDVSQEAYTLKSWLQVNLQECYQVFYKPDDDVINLLDCETSCTNQLYMYLKQHALNTTAANGVGYSEQTIVEVSDKMDYVLCIGSVNTDIVNYLNYCEKALLQFITKLEDRCTTIYCILDIGEAKGISQAFQILPKNEIWQGQVEVFSAVVPGAKLNFCVILKIVPSQITNDCGNLSQTEKCNKRLGDVSAVVNGEKKAKF